MYKKVQQEYIMRRVETVVCDIINSAQGVQTTKHNDVTPSLLYDNSKKCTSAVSLARQFVFMVLHDSFGFSYKQISHRSKMRETSIMKCVRKVRTLIFIDTVYSTINRLVVDALKDGLL